MGADMAPMEIEFDPEKDLRNRAKHGISLAMATELDWGRLVSYPDTRHEYGEARFKGYGPIGLRLYCVIYTLRSTSIRIISLRKANNRELLSHGQTDTTAH
jgi:uncharacterized DUF497 family protein